MALTLIATGEHYVFDVLLGWLYAGLVMAAWAWWERRRTAPQGPAGELLESSALPDAVHSPTPSRVASPASNQL